MSTRSTSFVVLCSGGLDSAVALATARARRPSGVLHALFVDFGHRTRKQELRASRALADHYGAHHHVAVVGLPWFSSHWLWSKGKSLLAYSSDESPAPETTRANIVPHRNVVIASVAITLAAHVGARTIYAGWDPNRDRPGALDKKPAFRRAFNKAARLSGGEEHGCSVVSVLDGKTKTQIVRLAKSLRVPISKTWSCYNSFRLSCGVCPPCDERRTAFKNVGSRDPVSYLRKSEALRLVGTVVE